MMQQLASNKHKPPTTHTVREGLLSKGMFPSQLPSPFDSTTYGSFVSAETSSLPGIFTPNSDDRVKPYTDAGTHYLARSGNLNRRLGIVNPIRFYNLADAIAQNWNEIHEHFERSDISASRPLFDRKGERSVRPRIPWDRRKALKSHTRTKGKYLLKTDVEKCFPNIYTHSIAWGLHTKEIAKDNIGDHNFVGNLLDDRQISLQDRQTNGIPIGPDTSLVLSEIILTRIDHRLSQEIPLRGFRSVDDYELCFTTKYDAQHALSKVQRELSRYGMNINHQKTDIRKLPVPAEESWVHTLRRYYIDHTHQLSEMNDLYDFFGHAFRLARKHERDSVIKYALKKVSYKDIDKNNFEVYVSLLLQCAAAEEDSMRIVLRELYTMQQDGCSLNEDRIQETIEDIVIRNSLNMGSSEIAWAIWASISLNIQLTIPAVEAATTIDDPIIPLLLLHAKEENLTPTTFTGSEWEKLMTEDELYGPYWLLSYEAKSHEWLPSHGCSDHIGRCDGFSFLRDNDVSFYNKNKHPLLSVDLSTGKKKSSMVYP